MASSALAVRATHAPQVDAVVKQAQGVWGMNCDPPTSQVDCHWTNFDNISWLAIVKPGSGNLTSLQTRAALYYQSTDGLDSYSRQWMVDLHNMVCADLRTVTAFVSNVGNRTAAGNASPVTVPGECNLTGGLLVVLNVEGGFDHNEYWINSAVIAPAATPTPTLSPSPTPAPTATPKPTASPTATSAPTSTLVPGATATPRPSATPTATPATSESAFASASTSASASASASTSETGTPTLSDTPEQSVKGETFSPEPSVPDQAPDEGVGGWPDSIPGAGDVSTKAADIGGSALAAALMLVAMGFIGELFNNTTETNYDRIIAWWKESWVGRIGRGFAGLFGGGST